ncbi:MAG TPA: isoaspartyl peptidase/L-asparaginase [Prolixibacteraceae bacterium]|nr:isoaspartyl peptidase/L-asparaginase [Prolixibacteraceae bacterium]
MRTIGICLFFILLASNMNARDYVLVIHGGAGLMSPDMPQSRQKEYATALDSALSIGRIILENGGMALDAVEQVIAFLEDCPLFNAGRGAVFTWEGKTELDASIMDGSNRMAGAVTGVTRVKHPIKAAREVMEKSPHVMLSGKGADLFARQAGLEMVSRRYFRTKAQRESFHNAKKARMKDKLGTVGCVALDVSGNLAAGTSTGGMVLKRWGRIGDSPVIGAGTYAHNPTCAVSCTGHGEYFIRLGIARDVASRMAYKNLSLEAAAEETLDELTQAGGAGGFIALDREGNIALKFNTPGMFRAYVKQNGEKSVEMFP